MTSVETAQQILDRLEAPRQDLRFLLERGYRRAHALRFVGEHHQLTSADRNVLERVVFARDDAESRRARLVEASALRGQEVVIDGYNVLISTECIFDGAPLFLADDGVVRDIAARRGLRLEGPGVSKGLAVLFGRLRELGVERVDVILDEQVSRSGELAALCRAELARHGIAGDAQTTARADHALVAAGRSAVVCTSDRVIIDGVPRVFDAVRAIAEGRVLVGRAS